MPTKTRLSRGLRRRLASLGGSHREAGKKHLHQGADAERKHGCSDADRPAERNAETEHEQLDRSARDANGSLPTADRAFGKAGHQTVTRPRSEAGTDVEARTDQRSP